MFSKHFWLCVANGLAVLMVAPAAYPADVTSNQGHPRPILVLEAKWGKNPSKDIALGVDWTVSTPSCFSYMAVRGKQIFIADLVFDRIAVFEGGKFLRAYPQPSATRSFGLVVRGHDLFELDQFGKIVKIDLGNSKAIISPDPVLIDRFGTGLLTGGTYTFFSYDDQLIVNRSDQGVDVCVGMDNLRVESCGAFPGKIYKPNEVRVTLDGEQYVTLSNNFAILHDRNGKPVASAYWPDTPALCGDQTAWAVTDEGLYFTEQAEKLVRVYFQPWKKPD